MTDQMTKKAGKSALLWAFAFIISMCTAVWLSVTFELEGLWSAILMLLAMLALIPMVSASQKAAKSRGNMTPAVQRYNSRFMVMSFGYVATLLGCVGVYNSYAISGPLLWLLALLPTVPIMGMVWTMARLLIEEDDEYQRRKVINSALIATGITLVVCTLWGFLETFGLVPHVWMWAVFPFWAISLGVGQFFVREKT